MKVRKAVLPVAGLGTRFLPATKASPKEMLPLVDKPAIQYVVEEAKLSGIELIIMVTGRGKRSIEDHFDTAYELEGLLEKKGDHKLLREIKAISNLVSFCFVRQSEALGLGHAILCAKDVIGNEPFAVLLPDMIVDSETPALEQVLDVHYRFKGPVIAVEEVEQSEVSRYGIIRPEMIEDGVYRILDMVEKPKPEEAPSNLAISGRYILPPEIFRAIEQTIPSTLGEIQLTDALKSLVNKGPVYACRVEGKLHDTGNKLGFLQATVELALKNPELGDEFRNYLKGLKL
ncbi:MAG: UTP--glucose-1-phosphate uridylyltransferase GalU [Planctomycetota bacterium]|jgi:UTP--glucose-1-phosphate uridylyltransferase